MSNVREESGAALHFAFLLRKQRSERWGDSWFASSVLTGHMAEGRTRDSAIRNLRETIDAEIETAAGLGLSAEDWFGQQSAADPKHVEEWCRLVALGRPEKKRRIRLRSGHTVEVPVVTDRAA